MKNAMQDWCPKLGKEVSRMAVWCSAVRAGRGWLGMPLAERERYIRKHSAQGCPDCPSCLKIINVMFRDSLIPRSGGKIESGK